MGCFLNHIEKIYSLLFSNLFVYLIVLHHPGCFNTAVGSESRDELRIPYGLILIVEYIL